jgi:excisionase family DNA binding protein
VAPRPTLNLGPEDRLLTVREVAAYLGVSAKTVERKARQGRLPSLRVFGRVRFRRSDVASWLAEREDRTCRDC